MAVVIQLREGRRGREGRRLPEPFDGFMIEPIARFIILKFRTKFWGIKTLKKERKVAY